MPIGIIPRLKVKKGKDHVLEQVLASVVAKTRANEPGSRFYSAFKSRLDGTYILMEVFDDEPSFQIHRDSPYILSGVAQINELLAEPFTVEFFDEIDLGK